MNLLLLTNSDLASHLALSYLLPHLTDHHVEIGYSSFVDQNHQYCDALRDLAEFDRAAIHEFQRHFPVMLDNGKNASKYSVQNMNEINSNEGVETVSRLSPDVIVSIRFGVILKSSIISLPLHGVINLHSGLLPNYRGVMATFWALLNGDDRIGTTLHYIQNNKIDVGDVISTTQFKVNKEESYFWHLLRLYQGGCNEILHVINAITEKKEVLAMPQNNNGAYFTFPNEKDLNLFCKNNRTLFSSNDTTQFFNQLDKKNGGNE